MDAFTSSRGLRYWVGQKVFLDFPYDFTQKPERIFGQPNIYQRDKIGAGPYRMNRSSTGKGLMEGIVQKGQHK